ncbi:MAG TPA: hypothetical protein VF483_13890 [Gemmatimonadaceae bacterium]
MKLLAVVALGFSATCPRLVAAQDSAALRRIAVRDTGSVPVSARPPAGMCRIWLDDVPVSRQPAPTDCASAVRNRPPKGRVVFGDDYVKSKPRSDSHAAPFMKGFAPSKPESKPVAKKKVRRDTLDLR